MPFLFLECRSAECSGTVLFGVGQCWLVTPGRGMLGSSAFHPPSPSFHPLRLLSSPYFLLKLEKKKKISVPSFPSVMKMESCDT